jgi:hypothetical protein
MTNTKTIKECIRFLESCEDGIGENEEVREWYHQAIKALWEFLIETEDLLEYEYSEKYTNDSSYYNF